jgi:isopenicillin N synthase-like dioxygenase
MIYTMVAVSSSPPPPLHPPPLPPSALRVHAPTNHADSIAWTAVVQDLINVGVSLLDLRSIDSTKDFINDGSSHCDVDNTCSPVAEKCIPESAFVSSIAALDWLGTETLESLDTLSIGSFPPVIDECVDSAHATGYHRAGSMSARYNKHREGFVFSNGNQFAVQNFPDFAPHCDALFQVLHSTANQVLDAIGRHLRIPTCWFQDTLGPTIRHSQWHIKRYVNVSSRAHVGSVSEAIAMDSDDSTILLPKHTDPSLISVVVLHRPGVGIQPGALGLKYYHNAQQIWREIPFSGHNVAIVFVGSVLQHITGEYMTACKHRVDVMTSTPSECMQQQDRMAATLFVRPAPNASLTLVPSSILPERKCKRLTFAQWSAKTARNYERAKERQVLASK